MSIPNFEDMTIAEAQEYVLKVREAFIIKLYKLGLPVTAIAQRMGGSSYVAVRKVIKRHESDNDQS